MSGNIDHVREHRELGDLAICDRGQENRKIESMFMGNVKQGEQAGREGIHEVVYDVTVGEITNRGEPDEPPRFEPPTNRTVASRFGF